MMIYIIIVLILLEIFQKLWYNLFMNEKIINDLMREATDLRNNGQENEAIKKYQRLIKVYKTDGNLEKIGYCWQMIGVCYNLKKSPNNALNAIKKAIVVFRKLKDDFNLGCAYRDIGLTLTNAEKYTTAIKNLRLSIKYLSKTDKYAGLGISQAKLGVAYLKDNNIQQARRWMNQGLTTIRREGDWFMEATALLNLAGLDFQEKKFSVMIDKLWAALGLILNEKEENKQQRRLAEIYGLLAQGYYGTGNSAFAKKFLTRCRKILYSMPIDVQNLVIKNTQINNLPFVIN